MYASGFRTGLPSTGCGGAPPVAGDPADTQTGYPVRLAKDSRYHRIAVVEDDSPLPPLRQLLPERMHLDKPFDTRFEYTDYLQLALAYARARPHPVHRARRRFGAEADVARLPELQLDVGRARPRGRLGPEGWFGVPRDPRLR